MPSSEKENLDKFKDFFGIELSDLYFEIKSYLNVGAFDLLNRESPNSHNDFIELIFKNVRFEPMEEEDLEDDFETVDTY
jgi:hypothetical protein